jgi:hypothetical protein
VSARPVEQKKRRRVAKAVRRQKLPAYFDLFQWLIDRGHAKSRREARELVLAKRVKADSHVIGVAEETVMTPSMLGAVKVERKPVAQRFVRTDLRSNLLVLPEVPA